MNRADAYAYRLVMCPFCKTVFDTLVEPTFQLRVDGVRRTAHLRCFEEISQRTSASVHGVQTERRPNGGDQ
jgi:hypothetical protein